MLGTLRQDVARIGDRRGSWHPQVIHRRRVPGTTKPPGRVMRRSPSPCERRTRYPRGFDAGERRTPGGSASTHDRSHLWTTLGIAWGHLGVLLWILRDSAGDKKEISRLRHR